MARPTLEVRVESTAPALSRRLRRLARDQLPFATAQSLTQIAKIARDVQRAAMPGRFQIRSKRVITGIQIRAARKRDTPIEALVGTKDPFIARHEFGGIQRTQRASPGTGPPRFAVPVPAVHRRRNRGGKLPVSLQPRKILARGTAVVTEAGTIQLKRKRKTTLGNLRTLFTLHRTIRLKKTLRLRETVTEVARNQYAKVFQRNIKKALDTRR